VHLDRSWQRRAEEGAGRCPHLTFYAASDGRRVLEQFRDFMSTAPDELMAIAIFWNAPDGEPIPEPHRGAPVLAIVGCWSGPLEEGDAATRPLREVTTPIVDLSGPMPFVSARQLFDPDYPSSGRYYWKSLHLPELGDDVVDFVTEIAGDRPTPHSTGRRKATSSAERRSGRMSGSRFGFAMPPRS
jgi:hypothetical protein